MVDASCTPAYITFPTDLKLLNKAREKSEEIIKKLGYLKRNLKTIRALSKEKNSPNRLEKTQYKNLLVINEVSRQQAWMYENRENKIEDRIVSVSQPHVRPIKRGKARCLYRIWC